MKNLVSFNIFFSEKERQKTQFLVFLKDLYFLLSGGRNVNNFDLFWEKTCKSKYYIL